MSGRPSDYSPEIASAICERIADGESLRKICLDDDMPARSTVFLWLAAHEAFSDQYTRAREAQAEVLFEDMLEIADETSRDTKYVGEAGAERAVADAEWISRSKLRVDTRKWMASKLAPKKYGDRIQQDHSVVSLPEELAGWLDKRS